MVTRFCLAPGAPGQCSLQKCKGLVVLVGTAGYPREWDGSGLGGREGAILTQPLQQGAVFSEGFERQVPCS